MSTTCRPTWALCMTTDPDEFIAQMEAECASLFNPTIILPAVTADPVEFEKRATEFLDRIRRSGVGLNEGMASLLLYAIKCQSAVMAQSMAPAWGGTTMNRHYEALDKIIAGDPL